MWTVVILMAAASLLTACATGGSGQQALPEVWLLMGQSNMSGRGDPAELAGQAFERDPRILNLGNDGVLRVAREPVDSAAGQIDAVSADPMAAVGPALAFARARIAANPARRLVLVPCARGGSAIAEWAPATARTTLFGSCMARAREAGRTGRLAGVLWYQGESDARSEELAAGWTSSFSAILGATREALATPGLPVLVVSLADAPLAGPYAGRYRGWDTVQAAQARLDLPGTAVVSASGLAKNGDDLHLSTAGQQILGARLAAAAEQIAP